MPFGDHTLFLSLEGDLFVCGDNFGGQLGLGDEKVGMTNRPMQVAWEGPRLVWTDCGFSHSLVMDIDGGVWEAGRSRSMTSAHTFQRVSELPPVSMISAGYQHNAALGSDGALWVWTNQCISWASAIPKQVPGLPLLCRMASGWNFLVGESEDGLWVLGHNTYGQLGLGHTNEVPVPTFVRVPELVTPLRSLEALNRGILLVDGDGAIWTAGDNSLGQLGRDGDTSVFQRINGIPPMSEASCGCSHSLAKDENGGLWTWGWGRCGQLGTNDTLNQTVPTLIPSISDVHSLVAGGNHSFVYSHEGEMFAFGANSSGQLGLGHKDKKLVPTLSPVTTAPPCRPKRQKSARS